MSRVTAGFSMSLDGFVADPDDGVDQVFKWYSAGGTDAEIMTGDSTFEMSREGAEFIEEAGRGAGVLVTARRTFDLAHAWGGKHQLARHADPDSGVVRLTGAMGFVTASRRCPPLRGPPLPAPAGNQDPSAPTLCHAAPGACVSAGDRADERACAGEYGSASTAGRRTPQQSARWMAAISNMRFPRSAGAFDTGAHNVEMSWLFR